MFAYNARASKHGRICQLIYHINGKTIALKSFQVVFAFINMMEEKTAPHALVAWMSGPGKETVSAVTPARTPLIESLDTL